MKPDLPDILDRYFKAQNAHDIDAMVACFARMPPCATRATLRRHGRDPRLEDRDEREVPHHGGAARKPHRGRT